VWQANRLPHFAPPARPPRPSAQTPARWHCPCQTLRAHTLPLLRARPHVHELRAPRSTSARHALRLTLTTLLPALRSATPNLQAQAAGQWWQSSAAAGWRLRDCSAVVQPPSVSASRVGISLYGINRRRESAHQSPNPRHPCLACSPVCRDALLTLCCCFPSLAGRDSQAPGRPAGGSGELWRLAGASPASLITTSFRLPCRLHTQRLASSLLAAPLPWPPRASLSRARSLRLQCVPSLCLRCALVHMA
jgi:hypothetical protein